MTDAGHKSHLFEFDRLTEERRRELEGDEDDPWGEAAVSMRYRAKERYVGLRSEDGLIASAGLVVAEVEVAGERFDIVGLGGVIVRASYRGRGLARDVVNAALERAAGLGPAFVLLFCLEDRAGLYRKLGFVEIEDDVLVEQPEGYVPMPLRTMWRPLHHDAVWPRGEVIVHGLPF